MREAADARIDAATAAGLTLLVERYRYRWTPGCGLPDRTGRLRYHPEHRGHGYAYDLLVEATWLLVDEGGDRIVANTDTTNVPMAAAFARAGYPIIQHQVDMVRRVPTRYA